MTIEEAGWWEVELFDENKEEWDIVSEEVETFKEALDVANNWAMKNQKYNIRVVAYQEDMDGQDTSVIRLTLEEIEWDIK